MRILRLVDALFVLACATGATACADQGGVCDGSAIEMRQSLADPVAETDIACTGDLTGLCAQPVVRLDQSRCEAPQLELATAGRDDLFVGLTLTIDDGAIVEALAAVASGGDAPPFDGGWLQLYAGSLDEPEQLSGELALWMSNGAQVAGRFSALANP